MNKLALCQRLATEAEVSGASSGTLPSATTGQTGEMLQVVRDIENAYEELQNLRPNWLFMREDFSFNTVSGTAAYTPTAAGLTDFRAWRTDTLRAYLTATGVADEQWLEFVPWDRFRDSYMLADQRTTPGDRCASPSSRTRACSSGRSPTRSIPSWGNTSCARKRWRAIPANRSCRITFT